MNFLDFISKAIKQFPENPLINRKNQSNLQLDETREGTQGVKFLGKISLLDQLQAFSITDSSPVTSVFQLYKQGSIGFTKKEAFNCLWIKRVDKD